TADQVRVGDQPQNREGARPRYPSDVARALRRGDRVKRREFITLLGGAVTWPLAARAQQPAPGKWKIGLLFQQGLAKPIRDGLRQLGYVEGQNVTTELRHDDRADRLPALAAELVALKPDIIAAGGTQAAQAAQRATKTIPIVFVASNPVGNGLVASLGHPGGNATGLSLQSRS